MFIFPVIIILSVVFYIYYKVSILRTKDGLTQHYMNAKSRICLGVFLIAMAITQYVALQTKIALFICLVFFVLGILQAVYGFNAARHYRSEWKRLNEAEMLAESRAETAQSQSESDN